MNSILQERMIAVALQRKSAIERHELLARPSNRVPTRKQVKQARKSFTSLAREAQPDCMLNMPRPAHHRPIPMFTGEREKTMFAAQIKRREAGWIRG